MRVKLRILSSGALPPCPQERHGVDLRTAALQFSAAPDVAVALVVGGSNGQQILEDYNSMHAKIPADFWQELKASGLIEQGAVVPT